MPNPNADKTFFEEVQQIIKEGIQEGVEAREKPERDLRSFRNDVRKIAQNARIIK